MNIHKFQYIHVIYMPKYLSKKKIREKMRAAQDQQKKYVDLRRRKLEFEEGDRVFLKISLTKGVKRFGMRGKLSLEFIGPYEILRRVGEVAYELAFPVELSKVHRLCSVHLIFAYFRSNQIRSDQKK